MPATLSALALLVAFVLPGYIVVRLSRRRRPYAPATDQLEILLQALAWSLAIHLAVIPWTAKLYEDFAGSDIGDWTEHTAAIFWYSATVLIVIPVVLGTVLNRYLRREEEGSNKPPFVAELLGAGGPPQAWDKFGLHVGHGGFVIARTKDGVVIAGKLGKDSWVSASPGAPDMILEEAWWSDGVGNPVAPISPRRVVWINAAEIEYLHAIPDTSPRGRNG